MQILFRIALGVSIVTVVGVSQAAGQDKGQVGLVVGYPATVGVLWQISDRIGIRGEGSFSWSSSKIEEPAVSSSSTFHTYNDGTTSVVTFGSGTSIGVTQESRSVIGSVGISALITLTRSDTLHTYVAPRVAWAMSRSTTTIEYDLSGFSSPTFGVNLFRNLENQSVTTKSTTPSYGAAFGATTTLRDRFGVFGELGFNYSASGSVPFLITSRGDAGATRTARTVSLRSGIGVNIFF